MTYDIPTALPRSTDHGTRLTTADLAADLALTRIAASFRFLLAITPRDADTARRAFLDGEDTDPVFTYRDLDIDPDVLATLLQWIDVEAVEDEDLSLLLHAKHRELEVQLEMLRARGTPDFLRLSLKLYGTASPELLATAEEILDALPPNPPHHDRLDAEQFHQLAETEIEHYRELDADIGIHAEVRSDVSGILVQGNTLLISSAASVARARAQALIQHEIGTHLVTHVNGSGQPIRTLSEGLAGYDETQEGLAVLAEIGCGQLTVSRLRQLATRVLAVHRLVEGASFTDAYRELVDRGVPQASAFMTAMRVYRCGGFTKDAIYLRGLVDLLAHLRADGDLSLLFLGKFSLEDLPRIRELADRSMLAPARVTPRYLTDPDATARLAAAAAADDLTTIATAA